MAIRQIIESLTTESALSSNKKRSKLSPQNFLRFDSLPLKPDRLIAGLSSPPWIYPPGSEGTWFAWPTQSSQLKNRNNNIAQTAASRKKRTVTWQFLKLCFGIRHRCFHLKNFDCCHLFLLDNFSSFRTRSKNWRNDPLNSWTWFRRQLLCRTNLDSSAEKRQ